jgi:Skp family chaperone for outer membrane proteins
MIFMRKMVVIRILLAFFLGHVLLFSSAFAGDPVPSLDDVKKELSEAMDAMRAYSEHRQAEAIKAMEAVLEKMDARIAALSDDIQNKWEKLEPEAREKARESLERLRRLRDRTAKSIAEWKSGGKITWDKIKQDFLNAWEEFQKTPEDQDATEERPITYL